MVLTSCTATGPPNDSAGTPPPATTAGVGSVFPAAQIAPLVAGVVHRTVKPLPTMRLAEGLVPPTNRWFSGLVFGDPQPVFPLPLSFGLTARGIAFGQPTITTTAKNIAGGYVPAVAVDLGASSAVVTGYDALSVTVGARDATGDPLGHTVLAEGSPFVSYHAERAGSVSTTIAWTAGDGWWSAEVNGVTYGMVVTDGDVTGGTVRLQKTGVATWFPVPEGGTVQALATLARHPVTGGTVGYRVGAGDVTTTLTYRADAATAYARMPHQSGDHAVGDPTCDLGSYPSIYGTMTLCAGTELAWRAPLTAPTSALDVSRLTAKDKAELVRQVTADVAATPAFPADTYFGGKALYRAAMLYQLAIQVGADDAAAAIKTRLVSTLDQWTDPQGCAKRAAYCFVYDEKAHGLVGLTPSFGSEEFNDHHFHYGYFLFAAGVLAESDPSLVAKWAPVMNLVAADVGSSATNGAFPDLRVFDAYAGHSWASGTSPFADGNNQESSSEAATAWTGLATWAKASGNEPLRTEAVWLLSLEAQSGATYWTDFDRTQPVYTGFEHQVVSLNWGGKRDYGTWFSAEPAAMLGILVIPMSPAATYLGGDPARIAASVAEATNGNYDQKFGDYLLMYSGLAGEAARTDALATARNLDAKWLDDGNSRAYLLAWLMTLSS